MNFPEVVKDIEKLIGLDLSSIRPGANIEITNIDRDRGSLTLRTASGQYRSRPLEELKKIWGKMMISPAVHVEGVLYGSGTSRNQPETILANLPYVEWLKIDNKKHIAYVGESTHAYGTLKQMNPVRSTEIIAKMRSLELRSSFKTAIVANDVSKSISDIQNICQGEVTTLEKGVYQLETPLETIVFLSADICGLDIGTYCVLESQKNIQSGKRLSLYGRYYSVMERGDIKALIENTD